MKTLLLDTTVYAVDTSKRTNILSTRSATVGDNLAEYNLVLSSSASKVVDVIASNKATILHTSVPISLTLVVGATTLQVVVASDFVLTANITSLTITNSSATSAEVFIIQI